MLVDSMMAVCDGNIPWGSSFCNCALMNLRCGLLKKTSVKPS